MYIPCICYYISNLINVNFYQDLFKYLDYFFQEHRISGQWVVILKFSLFSCQVNRNISRTPLMMTAATAVKMCGISKRRLRPISWKTMLLKWLWPWVFLMSLYIDYIVISFPRIEVCHFFLHLFLMAWYKALIHWYVSEITFGNKNMASIYLHLRHLTDEVEPYVIEE